ncbi:MAG: UDP-N-acetylglucosamine-N-acetylmuramyl-(pentapeptide) pyrophosphoryl-UDP N-acetylglucosamine transferase [Parcubacteria group bacterium GW2011_GWA2_44_12]|nr:MAG: UDP-N-acetylglucosamine-N-acetylmuramyl-(pentapeptide) pyrophosphoryl-UDP N-acetylglucosamine transferase [Parcubacteria group bacterium GW2011_GWA2_44_12]
MKILFAGGGTLGSVMPLFGIKDECEKEGLHARYFWVGTKHGPEKALVVSAGIPFYELPTIKLRRYWSMKNVGDVFKMISALVRSLFIIRTLKPDVIISAGGFVAVPLIWISTLFRVKVMIHQQDIVPSLTNRLVQSCAHSITVAFEESLKDFPRDKTIWIGNPVRSEIEKGSPGASYGVFGFTPGIPTVLVLGGGMGSFFLNALIVSAKSELTAFCQIIHVHGGKNPAEPSERYRPVEFLRERLKEAYAVSDIVISRAGLSTLTELAYLAKPTILIPLADTHQERNAKYFAEHGAAVVCMQEDVTPAVLVSETRELLASSEKRMNLSASIHTLMKPNANAEFVKTLVALMSGFDFKTF